MERRKDLSYTLLLIYWLVLPSLLEGHGSDKPDEATLGTVRQKYLNQNVIVDGPRGHLLWSFAEQENGGFSAGHLLTDSYIQKFSIVILVRMKDSSGTKQNAVG